MAYVVGERVSTDKGDGKLAAVLAGRAHVALDSGYLICIPVKELRECVVVEEQDVGLPPEVERLAEVLEDSISPLPPTTASSSIELSDEVGASDELEVSSSPNIPKSLTKKWLAESDTQLLKDILEFRGHELSAPRKRKIREELKRR